MIISLIVIWEFILTTGCQANSAGTGLPMLNTASPNPVSPTQGDAQMTPSLPVPANASLQSLIEKTKEDLANRMAIPTEKISFAEITEVEWSDSSLGCPQPGMDYLQVITPGYRIVLEVNDQIHEYHSNRDTYFVYCENQVPPIVPQP